MRTGPPPTEVSFAQVGQNFFENSHRECDHGPGVGWPFQPTRRFLARCDTCRRWRPWADYFEVYDLSVCWWWECERCLLRTITAWGESVYARLGDLDSGAWYAEKLR